MGLLIGIFAQMIGLFMRMVWFIVLFPLRIARLLGVGRRHHRRHRGRRGHQGHRGSGKRTYYHGEITSGRKVVWRCEHRHQTPGAANECTAREWRRRGIPPASTAAAPARKDWRQPPVEGKSPWMQPTVGQAIKAAAEERRVKLAVQQAQQAAHSPVSPPSGPQIPVQLYPEPAAYVYYRVTEVQFSQDQASLRLDLVSDTGEPWRGVEFPVAAIGAEASSIQRGDRYTWDGRSLSNRVPVTSQGELQGLADNINAMSADKRAISHRDGQMVQKLRQGGYVFNADNRVVSVAST